MIGYSLRTGFLASYIYANMRDVRENIMADDANIGGARVKGQFSEGEESEASPMVMAAMGWFRGLVLELEPMPNSDLHELGRFHNQGADNRPISARRNAAEDSMLLADFDAAAHRDRYRQSFRCIVLG